MHCTNLPLPVPVDHAFFLANFCTTSIASTMVSSSMPDKRDSITTNNSNAGGFQNTSSASSYDMHSKKTANAAVNYYDMNNGTSGGASGGTDMYNGAEFMAVAAAVAAQQQKQPSAGDLVGKNLQVISSWHLFPYSWVRGAILSH